MRLKVKNGDLVRNRYTGQLFVVTDHQGYDYFKGANSEGTECILKRWDYQVFDGINEWRTIG